MAIQSFNAKVTSGLIAQYRKRYKSNPAQTDWTFLLTEIEKYDRMELVRRLENEAKTQTV